MYCKPRKDFRLVGLAGSLTLQIASGVCAAKFKRIRNVTRPQKSIVSLKRVDFLSFSMAPAFYKSEKTLQTLSVCCSCVLLKIAMSFRKTSENGHLMLDWITPLAR